MLQLVSTQLSCSTMNEFSTVTTDYEALTVQCKNAIFVVVYRPPDGKLKNCFAFLEDLLNFVLSYGLQITIGGDFNINILQASAHSRDLELLFGYFGCMNVIKEPTRMGRLSQSLIDVFITSDTSSSTMSGVIGVHIGDHLPIYMFSMHTEILRCKQCPESFAFHDINQNTLTTFRQKIPSIWWNPLLLCTTADDAYDTFLESYKDAYKKYFPLKMVKKNKNIRKPWITDECLKMIRKKDIFYHKFVKTKNRDDFVAFKKYRNFVTKFLRYTKKMYFEHVFSEASSRRDVMWRELNKLLHPLTPRNDDFELTVDNKPLKGQELATKFNHYLTNLMQCSHNESAMSFLKDSNPHRAFFSPVTPQEIWSIFLSLKNSKAIDIDRLQIRPIKFVLDLLVSPLSHIYNLCLTTGVFPKKMQQAKVTLLFKSGDKINFSNYRPVSVLPVILKG